MKMALNTKIGVIGAGKMAGAIVKGWIRAGVVEANKVMTSVPQQDKELIEPLLELGCQGTYDNKEVVKFADTILLGVKPTILPRVASSLKSHNQGSQLLISMA